MKEKLVNFLHKKPVRIILKIFDVLVYAFAIFMLIVMLIGGSSCHNNDDNHTLEGNNEPRTQNVVYNDEYGLQSYYFMSDFMSGDFIKRFIFEVSNYNGDIVPNNVNTTNFTFTNVIDEIMYVNTNNFTITPTNNSFYKVDYIKLTKENVFYANQSAVATYRLDIHNTTARLARFSYVIVSPLMDNNNHDLSTCVIRSATTDVNVNVSNLGDWCVYENTLVAYGVNVPFTQFYLQPIISDSVDNFNSGYNAGYNNGYNAGYNVGLNDNSSDPYNVFGVVALGFQSVASLFNIQLFPNITLGTLILTPVIIVIIIAIFHLFKG